MALLLWALSALASASLQGPKAKGGHIYLDESVLTTTTSSPRILPNTKTFVGAQLMFVRINSQLATLMLTSHKWPPCLMLIKGEKTILTTHVSLPGPTPPLCPVRVVTAGKRNSLLGAQILPHTFSFPLMVTPSPWSLEAHLSFELGLNRNGNDSTNLL